MLKKLLLLAFFIATPALAQNVQQSGTVTRNHLPYWVSSGVIGDGGSSADSPISSIGVTNNGGAGFCVSSDRQSAVGRNQLCLGAQTNGPATISLQNSGTATAQNLNFVVNGVTVTIPTGSNTILTGTGVFGIGDVPCFVSTVGVLQDCGLQLSNGTVTTGVWQGTPVSVSFGGTGASTTANARTNLGLGTMATQNANNVAITGGTETGLPTPVNPTDVAIKSYVDATATGLTILAPSALATAAVLPNTPTYNNGASGVGATLTAGGNSTLTVDGIVATLNTVVLVKNQVSAFQNGIYTVTTAGSGAAAWVLTRATYFNQASNMLNGSYTLITGGSANTGSSWVLSGTVTTVGTTAANFNQFGQTNTGVVSVNGVSGAITLGSGLNTSGSALSNTGVLSVGGITGAITCGTGINCSGSTISALGGGGTYDVVIQYGADPTGVSSSTAAINSAIAACAAAGGTVKIPPGTFLVNGGLNLSPMNNGLCKIQGGGQNATILKTTTGTNAILDMLGVNTGVISDLEVNSSSSGTNFGIAMTQINGGSCNIIQLNNVVVVGTFQKALIYDYGCTEVTINGGSISNSSGSIPTAVVYISATNALSFASSYGTVATGALQSGGWLFNGFQIHDQATPSGFSSVVPLYISGSFAPVRYNGGIIAGSVGSSSGGTVVMNGVSSVSFDGVNMYADNGQQSTYAFYGIGSVTGMSVHGSTLNYATAILSGATGVDYISLDVTGNNFSGGSFAAPFGTNLNITNSHLDPRGLAINLGASGSSYSHNVAVQPGAITAATQTSNGAF
jgi:hypothetical protein